MGDQWSSDLVSTAKKNGRGGRAQSRRNYLSAHAIAAAETMALLRLFSGADDPLAQAMVAEVPLDLIDTPGRVMASPRGLGRQAGRWARFMHHTNSDPSQAGRPMPHAA